MSVLVPDGVAVLPITLIAILACTITAAALHHCRAPQVPHLSLQCVIQVGRPTKI